MKTTIAPKTTATRVFVKVLCIVFVVEVIVMVLLPLIAPARFPTIVQACLDATLLTIFAAPLLLWVIIRPILVEQEVRREAERQLLATHARLDLAADIQRRLLPKSVPVLPGVDVAAKLTPAHATSGDFYDFLSFPDGSVGIAIADVSGHGIDSALLGVSASAYLRALTETIQDPGELLNHLNRFLVEQAQEGRFITMFLARIVPESMSLTYAAAGHRAFLMTDSETVEILDSTCPLLGIMPDIASSTSRSISLRPGQTLVFVTDGIEECTAADGKHFGKERMLALLHSTGSLSSNAMLERLFSETRKFTGGRSQRDDMTAIVLKIAEPF